MTTRKEKLARAKMLRSLEIKEIVPDAMWKVECGETCKENCGGWHVVSLHRRRFTCDCPAGQYERFCKHAERTIMLWYVENQGLRVTFFASELEAKKQRRPYKPVLMLSGAVRFAVPRKTKAMIPFD